MKVLIVEDEIIIRKSMELTLKSAGIEVIPGTGHGDEAIAMAKQLSPDVVLMDIHLKGEMSGIEAARRIGAETECDLIFISAYDFEHEFEGDEVPRVRGYLSKPIREDRLLKLIRGE